MTFKIDNDIPIPKETLRIKWPFDTLEVGGSFAVSDEDSIRKLRNAVAAYNSRKSRKMIIRTVEKKDGTVELRCWRLE